MIVDILAMAIAIKLLLRADDKLPAKGLSVNWLAVQMFTAARTRGTKEAVNMYYVSGRTSAMSRRRSVSGSSTNDVSSPEPSSLAVRIYPYLMCLLMKLLVMQYNFSLVGFVWLNFRSLVWPGPDFFLEYSDNCPYLLYCTLFTFLFYLLYCWFWIVVKYEKV